jgi:alkylresorcinol/alkylpyrone synthase
MFITGLGVAAPRSRYTQSECWMALQASPQFAGLTARSRAILKKVLTGRNGIATRHLALDPLAEAFDLTPDALLARFAKNAPALAAEAGRRALEAAQVAAAQIDAVIVSTCTGYLCPGLSSYVSERLGLRPDVLALDLAGQGCGAALPNLRMADALLRSGRCGRAMSVCVEVCSAAFYIDNDPGVLISMCLFGDGAAAAVLSPQPRPGGRRVEWKADGSVLAPEERDFLRFESRQGMLRNVLSPCVPQLAARHAREVFNAVLARAGVAQSQIAGWIFHAGGREVLKSLQAEFGLPDQEVRHSAKILDEFGNLSSPFVLFALQAALEDRVPGGYWWMASFGAGFSSHGAVLEVE